MLNGRWFAGRMVLVEYLAPKVHTHIYVLGIRVVFGVPVGMNSALMNLHVFVVAVRVLLWAS